MTRGNRIFSTLMLVSLLTTGFSRVARSQDNAATESTRKTFTISGTIGLAGVALKGLPGNVVTDDNGVYSVHVPQNWEGKVTPQKEGYVFEPASRVYHPVTSDEENQNFRASLIMFTISGKAGLLDVVMKGFPEEVITDSDGRYATTVPYGWTGTVTPVKAGYRFEEPACEYPPVKKNYMRDFRPIMITLTISGSVGVPGVTMQGLPGNPVTDEKGVYEVRVDYAWAGIVTPTKAGYVFEPPSKRYTRIAVAQENQDYTARILTYTISGNVGLPGVRMIGLPGNVISSETGTYRATVLFGWSGLVVPEKPGFRFEPRAREYSQLRADYADQDFIAQVLTFTISGNTGVGGVLMRGFPGDPVSDSQGKYRAQMEYGWSGAVAPEKAGYLFTPAERAYVSITENRNDENFAAEPRMVTISNAIMLVDEPIQDVAVTADPGGYVATTDARGRYSVKVPYGWSGQLVMTKPGWEIHSPPLYKNVTTDIIDGRPVPDAADRPLLSSRTPSAFPQTGVSGSTDDVLVILTADASPEKIAETTEDMRVMLHIFREKLSEPRMILGVLRDYGSFFESDRKAEALYLQGTAILFVIQMDFPYSFTSQRTDEVEVREPAVDPVWQRARQKVHSPTSARAYEQSGPTQQMTFEQFREELLRSLKHATNIRYIEPNELVILTIVSQNEEADWSSSATSSGAYSRARSSFGYGGGAYGGSFVSGGVSGRGRVASSAAQTQASHATTVLTMQARKADVDAFARGDFDFEQFCQQVRTFTY